MREKDPAVYTPDMMGFAVLFATVAIAALAATGLLLRQLRRRAIYDHPNERSSHSLPTPRGGGLAIVPVVANAWIGIGVFGAAEPPVYVVVALAIILAGVFWVDDLRGLPVALRLAAQSAAIAVALVVAPSDRAYLSVALPPSVDLLLAGVLWLWFVNLFNFMDGIDGLAGGETASIGIGVATVVLVGGVAGDLPAYGIALAAAALGFLVWNWQPAKVFLGDVGSVPLGFAAGWLLLELAARGQGVAALILPLYYLADATLTLARRAARGERVWQAHREHFYQRAVQRGLGHAAVVGQVLAVNVVLVGLAAIAAAGRPGIALAGAVLAVGALLFLLGRAGGGESA